MIKTVLKWLLEIVLKFTSQTKGLFMPEPIISIPPTTPLNPRKRAILVGASSGIGAALAHRLAREGFTVACLARRAELLQTLCDEINQTSGETRAVPYTHDVTNTKVIPQLFKDIVTDFGGLDLFIFCAGISLPVALEKAMMAANAPKLVTTYAARNSIMLGAPPELNAAIPTSRYPAMAMLE